MRMGVRTVHWTARDPEIAAFVSQLNRALESRDDFLHTPFIATELLNDRLRVGGLYQDQVRPSRRRR